MFDELSDKLGNVFAKLRGRGVLTDADIKDGLREVRRVLLEADVNFALTREFLERVEKKAVGVLQIKTIQPAQQLVKIVYDELTAMLGERREGLKVSTVPPTIVMMVGLQGSGKTTTAAKLARRLVAENKTTRLVAADVYRPAAIDQLETLGAQLNVPVYADRTTTDVVKIAQGFDDALNITGVILTKLDGDARGGAALSIYGVLKKPIKYIGVGEKVDALEEFHPERMAGRILQMGDIVSLVEKAQESFDAVEAKKLEKKVRREGMDLEDFLSAMRQMQKLGPFENLLKLLPGVNSKMLKDVKMDPKRLKHIEAIVLSMTPQERKKPELLNGSRRARIAKGSGRPVNEINKLLEQFREMQKMMKKMSGGAGGKGGGGMPRMPFGGGGMFGGMR